jgi:hypothetical protein
MPNLKWLHWVHSATPPELLNMVRPIFSDEYVKLVTTKFPNSKIVYPNSYALPSVARNFGVESGDVVAVHHPTDICSFLGMDTDTERLLYGKGVLSADAICVYPNRLDRGKQDEYVIRTMAMVKTFGLQVKCIIADFHSTGGDKVTYRDELKQFGIDYGLSQDELIFLSEQSDSWTHEVPQQVIAHLQVLANVFILPSVSETYSLVAQEAGLMKQVMVLNYDFPPFRSIYGENAIYRKYSSRFDVFADPSEAMTTESATNTKYGSASLPEDARKAAEKEYHKETAGMIVARLRHPEMAMATYLRKNRNLQSIFKKEMEPLFYE